MAVGEVIPNERMVYRLGGGVVRGVAQYPNLHDRRARPMTDIRNQKGQFVSAAGSPREHGRFVKEYPRDSNPPHPGYASWRDDPQYWPHSAVVPPQPGERDYMTPQVPRAQDEYAYGDQLMAEDDKFHELVGRRQRNAGPIWTFWAPILLGILLGSAIGLWLWVHS
jgi:hypothetical protein